MADILHGLTPEDKAILQEMITQFKANRRGINRRTALESGIFDDIIHQSPELYVVLPPDTGIPGMTQVGEIGQDPDLGTSITLSLPDIAGREDECDLYRIYYEQDSPDVPLLEKQPQQISVHNYGPALSQAYIPVARTAFGQWVVLSGGGGGGLCRGVLASDPGEMELVRELVHEGIICYAEEETGTGTGTSEEEAGTGTSVTLNWVKVKQVMAISGGNPTVNEDIELLVFNPWGLGGYEDDPCLIGYSELTAEEQIAIGDDGTGTGTGTSGAPTHAWVLLDVFSIHEKVVDVLVVPPYIYQDVQSTFVTHRATDTLED